jgi:hypothetical protein
VLDEGGLRRLCDGLPVHRIERCVERFSEPARCRGVQLVPHDATPRETRADHHSHAVCVEHGDAFIGETAARDVERNVVGPHRFEVLAVSRTGSPSRRLSCSRRSCSTSRRRVCYFPGITRSGAVALQAALGVSGAGLLRSCSRP